MTVDIAHLRALLAASPTRPGTWWWDALEAAIRHRDANGDDRWTMIPQPLHDGATVSIDDADAALICAAVNALGPLLAIAEAAEKWRDRRAWENDVATLDVERDLYAAVDAARKERT